MHQVQEMKFLTRQRIRKFLASNILFLYYILFRNETEGRKLFLQLMLVLAFF